MKSKGELNYVRCCLASMQLNLAYRYMWSMLALGALLEPLRSTSTLPTSHTVGMCCAGHLAAFDFWIITNTLFMLTRIMSWEDMLSCRSRTTSATESSLSVSLHAKSNGKHWMCHVPAMRQS